MGSATHADDLRGAAVFAAAADVEHAYARMRATVPQLDRPATVRRPLTPAEAEAVATYLAAEATLQAVRRGAYSYIT